MGMSLHVYANEKERNFLNFEHERPSVSSESYQILPLRSITVFRKRYYGQYVAVNATNISNPLQFLEVLGNVLVCPKIGR